jgi:hypothetical protein
MNGGLLSPVERFCYSKFLGMASSTHFTCDGCGFFVEAWDEGNPYVRDLKGKRHYFYHPGHPKEMEEFVDSLLLLLLRERIVSDREAYLMAHSGNEGEFLCMDCGKLSRIDEERDAKACRKCRGLDLVDGMELEGRTCPKCRKGIFRGTLGAIS